MESDLLSDELDREIVMHREAHFSGSFDLMLDYYLTAGKGVQEHFDIRRIEFLKEWEKTNGENIAPLLLSGADAEIIAKAKSAYKKLRDLYLKKEGHPLLIADLILSEDEEAESEVLAIAREGKKMVPSLIDLVRSEDFYSALYPGYGHAPFLAAKCLGQIGDERIVALLFEMLEEGTYHDERIAIRALAAVGSSAKNFLIKMLKRNPSDALTTRAALALGGFSKEDELHQAALEVLRRPETVRDEILASYLVLLFEDASPKIQKELLSLRERNWPKSVREDFSLIEKGWRD